MGESVIVENYSQRTFMYFTNIDFSLILLTNEQGGSYLYKNRTFRFDYVGSF